LRAYVDKPKILVLDEATSSIDSESEHLIQRSSEKLTKGRTSVVIAHRLATVQNADKIILLEHGEIKEEGSHSELLSIDGKYKLLFDLQFER
jgi:ABC-type multidrug transport system fused ATPase/permease subunit